MQFQIEQKEKNLVEVNESISSNYDTMWKFQCNFWQFLQNVNDGN